MRCGRMHPVHARSSGSETLSRSRSLAGYTIDTHESEFSEATPTNHQAGEFGTYWAILGDPRPFFLSLFLLMIQCAGKALSRPIRGAEPFCVFSQFLSRLIRSRLAALRLARGVQLCGRLCATHKRGRRRDVPAKTKPRCGRG